MSSSITPSNVTSCTAPPRRTAATTLSTHRCRSGAAQRWTARRSMLRVRLLKCQDCSLHSGAARRRRGAACRRASLAVTNGPCHLPLLASRAAPLARAFVAVPAVSSVNRRALSVTRQFSYTQYGHRIQAMTGTEPQEGRQSHWQTRFVEVLRAVRDTQRRDSGAWFGAGS